MSAVRRRSAQSSCAPLLALTWVARDSVRPFGVGLRPPGRFGPAPGGPSRPARARPLCAGVPPPGLRAVALSCGPGRRAYGPRPAFARCSLLGPGRHRPGRSGRVLRSGSAFGRLRPFVRGPPSPGAACVPRSAPPGGARSRLRRSQLGGPRPARERSRSRAKRAIKTIETPSLGLFLSPFPSLDIS